MKYLLAFLIACTFFGSAMASTEITNPSYDGQAFRAYGLLGNNKKLANRICFLLTDLKSVRATEFTLSKKTFAELSTEFPRTFQESPFSVMTHAKYPTILSEVIVDGYMNVRDADMAIVYPLVEMGGRPHSRVKYFSKISCE